MSDRSKYIVLAGVAAAVIGIYLLLQSHKTTNSPFDPAPAAQNRAAPDFSLPGLNGEIVHLSDYRGKVVFLNVWATWCPPCREEMPAMENLYRKMKGEAFEILAVSIDAGGARVVAPFMERNKLSFPALVDPEGKVRNLYGVTGIPETYIIDKDGMIASRIIGPRDWAAAKSVRFLKGLAQKPQNNADLK